MRRETEDLAAQATELDATFARRKAQFGALLGEIEALQRAIEAEAGAEEGGGGGGDAAAMQVG